MSGVLGQVIYTSELDPAYRPARPPVLLTCTDVQPEAGWAHSEHIRRGRDDPATCQPCLDSVLRPRRGLGCQPGLTGLGPRPRTLVEGGTSPAAGLGNECADVHAPVDRGLRWGRHCVQA